jgi:hypothetical protein
MNSSTPTLAVELINAFKSALEEGMRNGAIMMWSALISVLKEHWLATGIIVCGLLVITYVKAIATGRWGDFGSVLYRVIFCGILFVVGLLLGPEIFVNDYFDIAAAIIGGLVFGMVGWILLVLGLRRR